MKYCIQCKDENGNIGDFGYSENLGNGMFKRITPMFNNLASFFTYCKVNNIELEKE